MKRFDRTRWRLAYPRFVARRLFIGFLTLIVVSVVVFILTDVLPGDQASAVLGRNATDEQLARFRETYGLDQPRLQRYWDWLTGFLTGDFGTSIGGRRPVSEILGSRVYNTAVLAVIASAVMFVVGYVLGTLAGLWQGKRFDNAVSGTSLALAATPEFVIGALLVLLFAVRLDWLPALSFIRPGETPLSDPSVLVLPVVTVSLVGMAAHLRMVRAGVVETVRKEYVDVARLRGIPERHVVTRHIVRNAVGPSVQTFAFTFLYLIAGIAVVESLFAYPGIGATYVDAVSVRDIPVVQAITMFAAAAVIVVNIVVDIVVVWLNPRLRTSLT